MCKVEVNIAYFPQLLFTLLMESGSLADPLVLVYLRDDLSLCPTPTQQLWSCREAPCPPGSCVSAGDRSSWSSCLHGKHLFYRAISIAHKVVEFCVKIVVLNLPSEFNPLKQFLMLS